MVVSGSALRHLRHEQETDEVDPPGRSFAAPYAPREPRFWQDEAVDHPTETWTLTTRWVFPVSAPPLEGGLVTVAGERIAAVEPRGARRADVDLGDGAVLPGLVNAHTHLDLTGMRGLALPSPDFTGWLRRVIAHRRGRSPQEVRADIAAGLAESLSCGTTLLADISGDGGSWDALAAAPLRAVVFREILGLPKDRAAQAWADATGWLAAHPATPTCRPGLGPHAPYSVRSALFFAAATTGAPASVHLAESAAERDLLGHRRGPFVGFLRELGVWAPDGLADDPEHVLRLCNGLTPVLFAHGNFLAPDAPIPDNGTIVYCPRTHAAFGHPPHPFRDFLGRGVRVALGTDSLASNPDLDLLAEARFLHRLYPDFPSDKLLRMATLAGAEALGWADETGSLAPGKSADLVVIPLSSVHEADPHRLVFASDRPVERVLFRGRWVASAPG
jgi:cytosine/adenosine deaminase-related metal-dependent hydrolase